MSKFKLSFALRQMSEDCNLFSGKPNCSDVFHGLLGFYSVFFSKIFSFYSPNLILESVLSFSAVWDSGVDSIGERVD